MTTTEFPLFKSQVESYQNASPVADNIRYVLAKKKIDELFIKWMSLPQTQTVVQKLIDDVKKSPQSVLNANLSPFLTSQKANLTNMSTLNPSSATLKPTPHTPPKSPNDFGKWRGFTGTNESGESSIENSPRHFDDRFNQSLGKRNERDRLFEANKHIDDLQTLKDKELSKIKEKEIDKFDKYDKYDTKEVKENKNTKTDSLTSLDRENETKDVLVNKKTSEYIPKFYFPSSTLDEAISDDLAREINEIFATQRNEELTVVQFEPITTRVFEIPKFLNSLVFARVDKDRRGKVLKSDFLKTWKSEYSSLDPQTRCFNILKKSNLDFITTDDIKPIMNIIMEVHPGLEFLKATPEFQDRYSDTVVQRIFYVVDRNDDGKISRRDFKHSNLFGALKHLDLEEDINKIRAYFSYEHFYVLYCKFWELDSDHDFFINKEEFSRYSGHALSKKTVDRIFDEIPRKFRSKQPGKMSYEDFVWFALSEEDKTTDRSIEYWFKILDLDNNGMITGYEMEYFYEEQKQRLEYLNHEPVYFEDIVCQLVDMFHPEKDIIFRMEHFKENKATAGTFFNCMTNLNKFVAYEQRDPFMIRNEINENPDYSEWDRFAQHEYIRLALEEENAENSGMLDSADLWDADDADRNDRA